MPFITKGATNLGYILIVLILATVVGAEILDYVKQFEQEITSLNEFSEIKKPEKIETETTNWKTYRNEKYGFEIKYPADFFYDEESVKGKIYFIENQYKEELWKVHHPFIFVEFISTNLTPREWVNKKATKVSLVEEPPEGFNPENYLYFGVKDVKQVKINNFDGVQFKSYAVSAGITHTILQFKEGLLVDIGNHISGAGEISDEIYNKMLSTFTKVGQETTDWKTYTNEKYGFEIKYPASISPSTTAPLTSIPYNSWTDRPKPGSKGEMVVSFVTCQFSDIPPAEPYHSFTSELRIGASSDPNDVKNCFNFENITPVNVNINGKEFKKFTIHDAAAGARLSVDIYRTIHNNTCFSIEKLNYGYLYDELEYPPSSHYNSEYAQKFNSCRQTIEQMLSTFKFLR